MHLKTLRAIFTAVSLAIFVANLDAAETIRIPVIADNSIVLNDNEWEENAGSQGRIRVKGNQHIVAMAFDTNAIQGKRVRRASLECVQGEQTIQGVTLSTIATPWNEAQSNGITAGSAGNAGWGYPGARFPAVMGGSGFTLVHQSKSTIQEGVYRWDVPPDMVHALAIGVAFGIAIHEHDADYGRNPTIFSREQSSKKPVLIVEVEDDDERTVSPTQLGSPTQLESPTQLDIIPTDSRSARLKLRAPRAGFAYEVLVDGKPLGRHNIPFVRAGLEQVIPLRDLPPNLQSGTHLVEVNTVSRTGARSAKVAVRGALSIPASVSKPNVAFASPKAASIPNVGVIPITDKFDSKGTAVGELPPDYKTNNTLFDGQTVRLTAAAGEVVGFQLLLKGNSAVTLSLAFPDTQLRTDLYQAVYVDASGRAIPDPLLPLPEKVSLKPDVDQVIAADVFIPFDSVAGVRKGSIKISDGRVIPIEVQVLPFALPRQATFFCEMNSYGLPDHVNEYYALQRIAYDHRVHANILHYSHHNAAQGSRKCNLDMRLPNGKRMDNKRYDSITPEAATPYWDDFVTAFGPFIDGSLFADGHRGAVPAPGFYLTFHESWPLNCRPYFNGNPDAYEAFADHPEYAQTYVSVMNSFAKLAQSKGWTQTGFQVYFNNKGSLSETSKAPWILDEPSSYWDYRALQFFGELTDRGRSVAPEVKIDYRIDISRPEFCRGQLHERPDFWVVSSWAFQHYRRLVTDRIEREGLKAWVYGTSNHVHETNRNIQAWALDAWQHGATGIVPWQTVDKSGDALRTADQLGLFIFDNDKAGEPVIHHSLRLKAYREAQQLIEYLNLLKQREGWSQDRVRELVAQYVFLDAEVNKTSEEDAGTTGYGRLSAVGLETLKRAVAELLMGG